jgi:hypothetical protein
MPGAVAAAPVDRRRRTGLMTTNAQIRTRDLGQAVDLLEGLQRIMASFHQEQRGRHEPDPIVQELEAITSHAYNWEALRYQEGVGEGWSYIAGSIEELRTRLLEAYTNAAHQPQRDRATPRGRVSRGRALWVTIRSNRDSTRRRIRFRPRSSA